MTPIKWTVCLIEADNTFRLVDSYHPSTDFIRGVTLYRAFKVDQDSRTIWARVAFIAPSTSL